MSTGHQTDRRLPWPARAQTETTGTDLTLTEQAQKAHPGVRWWWNQRLVGHVHGAWCYLCECHISTWARRWPMPQRAVEEVMAHRRGHLEIHAREV